MYRPYAMVRELAKTNPLPLLHIKDQKMIDYANSLLPYSIGIEWECSALPEARRQSDTSYILDKVANKEIPYLISVNGDTTEQRLRIPSGIKGLICLWHCSLLLKKYFGLNPESGIHYHVDMSEKEMKPIWRDWDLRHDSGYHREDKGVTYARDNTPWVMAALKSWGYKGKYNHMSIGYTEKRAVKLHTSYRTAEFRIGEMTFDYALLYKRISHCTHIVSKMKKDLLSPKMADKVEKQPKLKKGIPRRHLLTAGDVDDGW